MPLNRPISPNTSPAPICRSTRGFAPLTGDLRDLDPALVNYIEEVGFVALANDDRACSHVTNR